MIHPTTLQLHPNPESVLGKTLADHQPLSEAGRVYFLYGVSHIAAVVSFKSTLLRSDKKLHAAGRRALEMTPLWQTEILGDTENWPYFCQMTNSEDWPRVEILHEKDNDKALQKAHKLVEETVAYFDLSINNRRRAGRFVAIRGKSQTVFCFAVLHTFTDGAGISSIINKFLLYALLPIFSWCLIDRRSRDRYVPTVEEMALKRHWSLEMMKAVDASKSERFDPGNFSFAHANAPLNGLDAERVGMVSSARTMRIIRKTFRKSGISVTYACAAVAMKTLAALIAEKLPCKNNNNPGALVFMMPVDARPLNKWGDKRDRMPQLPCVANLSFLTFARIPFQELQESSVEKIASIIKQKVNRIYSDPKFLLQEIQATSEQDQIEYFCGCTSLRIPNRAAWLGLAPCHFETFRIGDNARCWITAVTFGGETEVVADIVLPIPGLTANIVRRTIPRVVQGSIVEPLFNESLK